MDATQKNSQEGLIEKGIFEFATGLWKEHSWKRLFQTKWESNTKKSETEEELVCLQSKNVCDLKDGWRGRDWKDNRGKRWRGGLGWFMTVMANNSVFTAHSWNVGSWKR